jgi:hypothetical protein
VLLVNGGMRCSGVYVYMDLIEAQLDGRSSHVSHIPDSRVVYSLSICTSAFLFDRHWTTLIIRLSAIGSQCL